jgi:hypothetical protein
MMAHKEAETGMSFFITKAQKAVLRRLGYSEELLTMSLNYETYYTGRLPPLPGPRCSHFICR